MDSSPKSDEHGSYMSNDCLNVDQTIQLASSKDHGHHIGSTSTRDTSRMVPPYANVMPNDTGEASFSSAVCLMQEHPFWQGLSRYELLLLILETLQSLNYPGSQRVLEEESGVSLHSSYTKSLQHHILDGNWDNVILTLKCFKLQRTSFQWCQFFVYEQVFMEHLYHKHLADALRVLREQLKPAVRFHPVAKKRIVVLSSFLVLQSAEALCHQAHWSPLTSRQATWRHVSRFLPGHMCPPRHRLAYLLHQALRFQELRCLNHGSSPFFEMLSPTLLADHHCTMDDLPNCFSTVLKRHKDDVWCISVSGNGKRIVSGSADGTVLLWQVEGVKLKYLRRVAMLENSVSTLSWSWSDRYFSTSATVEGIWDTETGASRDILSQPSLRHKLKDIFDCKSVSTARWVPTKHQLIISGDDVVALVAVHNLSPGGDDGNSAFANDKDLDQRELQLELLQSWVFRKNVLEVVVNYTGEKFIVCLGDKAIRILSLHHRTACEPNAQCVPDSIIHESDITTSLCASQLFDQCLVGVVEDRHVFRLWDIASNRALQRYVGHIQRLSVTSACFGGYHEAYVLSGSEDGNIYLWNKLYGSLLKILKGHTGSITATQWPLGFNWFVSTSNNRQVRLWYSTHHYPNKPEEEEEEEDDDDAETFTEPMTNGCLKVTLEH